MSSRICPLASLLIGLIILIPIPVFGFTFLGGWRCFMTTPGITTIASSDSPNDYSLSICMGKVPSPTITQLTVSATRDFQIRDANQLLQVSHAFGTMVRNGSIDVTVSISRYGVSNDYYNFPPYSISSQGTNHASLDYAKTGSVTMGLYRVNVTITYRRSPNDSWWNNSSPHVFGFRGL